MRLSRPFAGVEFVLLHAATHLRSPAVAVALVVGPTRIRLGAHWFADVLAAWLLGAAWMVIVITAHRL